MQDRRDDREDPATGELPRISIDDTGGPPRPRRFRRFRLTLKLLLFVMVIYFALVTVLPGVRKALGELRNVSPVLLGIGFALEMLSLIHISEPTRPY